MAIEVGKYASGCRVCAARSALLGGGGGIAICAAAFALRTELQLERLQVSQLEHSRQEAATSCMCAGAKV